MRNGAMFPPILLMAPDLLIDGNTRLKAAQRIGRQTFPAIIVDTKTRDMALILAASLNQMGGERLTPEEAHEAAMRMMHRLSRRGDRARTRPRHRPGAALAQPARH